jgi:colicin import membrane protein
VTGTHEITIELGGLRRQEFRRFLVVSAVAHLALVAAFVLAPEPGFQIPRGVVSVELVAAPASASPAAPAAAPRPKAPPKPAPPPVIKPKKVVLPAEPTTPKAVAKAAPVPKATPAPAKDYEDVLAQLRAEAGESAPSPAAPAITRAAAGPMGSPDGVAISPVVAAWLKRAKIHVRKNWVVPPGFRTQALQTVVQVNLSSSGEVRGSPKVTQRSGNPWYDEGVVRAIQKSSPLPAPPEAGEWNFVFLPEDSY